MVFCTNTDKKTTSSRKYETRIHEARLARGCNPGTGFIGKIRSVAPVVAPLVSDALLRSTVLGLTIDMRGYRTGKRTPVRESTFQRRDYRVLVADSPCQWRIYCPVREPDYLDYIKGQKRISSFKRSDQHTERPET